MKNEGPVPVNKPPSKVAKLGFSSKTCCNVLKRMKNQFSYLLLLRYGCSIFLEKGKKNSVPEVALCSEMILPLNLTIFSF